jgi:galactonate dehydratase
MIIEKIELFKVPPRWLFVKITTKSGLSGWGEPIVEGKAEIVMAAIKEFEPYLIGRNANQIEDIFQTLYRGGFYRGGIILMSAISGIEQALWDLKGKMLGVPVYELLGGSVRDKVRVYSWVGGDSTESIALQAKDRINSGFTAIKMNLWGQLDTHLNLRVIKDIKNRFKEIREAIGETNDFAIDFHGRIHKNMAKRLLKELEEFYPMFYEEPVLPEYYDEFTNLERYTSVPLATGERLVGRKEFKEIIRHGSIDILQPDLSHVGGIWEAKKIASWAESSDIFIALHCPLGPIAFASALQFDFCTHNVLIQETSLGIHYNTSEADLLSYINNKEDYAIRSGFIHRTAKPGLGVEIDEKFVKEMSRIGHNWRNPLWRNEDGSYTEW